MVRQAYKTIAGERPGAMGGRVSPESPPHPGETTARARATAAVERSDIRRNGGSSSPLLDCRLQLQKSHELLHGESGISYNASQRSLLDCFMVGDDNTVVGRGGFQKYYVTPLLVVNGITCSR